MLKKKVLKKFIITAIAVALVYAIVSFFAGKILKPIAVNSLKELTAMDVSIESSKTFGISSVRFKNIKITSNDPNFKGELFFSAQDVNLKFSFFSILRLSPKLTKISTTQSTLNVIHDIDRNIWNIPLIGLVDGDLKLRDIPEIKIANCQISYLGQSKKQTKASIIVPLEMATIAPLEQNIYGLYIGIKDSPGFEKSNFHGQIELKSPNDIEIVMNGQAKMSQPQLHGNKWDIGNFKFKCHIKNCDAQIENFSFDIGPSSNISITGAIYDINKKPSFNIDANLKNIFANKTTAQNQFVYSPKLLNSINPLLSRFCTKYSPIGNFDLSANCKGELYDLKKTKIAGKLDCKSLAIKLVKFPYLIENLKGQIDLTEKDAKFKKLTATHGSVDLVLSGFASNPRIGKAKRFNIKSPNMAMDDDLYQALNPVQKRLWFAFSPQGKAKIEYQLDRDKSGKDKKQLHFEMYDGFALYENFPLPLKNISGDINIAPDEVSFKNIISKNNDQLITANGLVTNIEGKDFDLNFKIIAKNLPLNKTLIDALGSEQASAFEQFDMTGKADATATITAKRGKYDYDISAIIKAESIIFSKLPTAITDATLETNINSKNLVIKKLQGKMNQGNVILTGQITPLQDSYEYDFDLQATDIILDHNFSKLIPPDFAKTYRQLNLSGPVDLKATLKDDKINADITLKGLKAQPDFFKYPLKDITGKISMRDNIVNINELKIYPGNQIITNDNRSAITVNGTASIDKPIKGTLSIKAADLPLDGKLAQALGADFQQMYMHASPSGKFSLETQDFTFSYDKKLQAKIAAKLILQDCSLLKSKAIENANFELQTIFDINDSQIADIEKVAIRSSSFDVKGINFENLNLDFDYDKQQQILACKSFVVSALDGDIIGDIELHLGQNEAGFMLSTSFKDLQIAKAKISDPNKAQPTGLLAGNIYLSNLDNNAGIVGQLKFDITDLKASKGIIIDKALHAIDRTKDADYQFDLLAFQGHIENTSLVIDNIDLRGKRTMFNGKGIYNIKENDISLELIAFDSTLSKDAGMLKSLMSVSGRLLVKINIDGKFDNPKIKTQPLPFIKDALELLGKPNSNR